VRRGSLVTLACVISVAMLAPLLAPHDPARQFSRYPYAPPMAPHLVGPDGHLRAPFAYALVPVSPIERRYAVDRSRPLGVEDSEAPVFLLGADALGRDVLSRTLAGARTSLGVALVSTALAIFIACAVGAVAGFAGGWADTLLMRGTELVLVLPAVYVALALRGALPLVLSPAEVFLVLVLVFGLAGWPAAARGVRGIVRTERRQEYAEAARAIGASPARILLRHLLPAAGGFLYVQALILVPAFIAAEATLSFVGFGFTSPAVSWGTMMQDAANVQATADAPWLLAPAAAMVLTILLLSASAPQALRRDAHTIM
jgi:peptide/nickel transport system permease protein